MQIRKQGHCAYQCEYHLVLVSKYRRKIFNAGSFGYFEAILKQVWGNIPEIKLLTINHDIDHIHMHLSIPPKVRVSDVVRTIKSITGRLLKKKFEYIRKAYWGIDGVWSDGYFVSTVGINEHIIKRYIEHQGQEDMGQAQLVLDL
ncbi:IS200/IS605 family transposase [Rickettsia endosymbiont of Pantilius tunicatus]|uniref:IS200/IS605 family transposase n=1 Tax=Rickettsia endosymbiont of Pantilius tunicatus TaxID=3066267 RepID=UPI0030E54AB0